MTSRGALVEPHGSYRLISPGCRELLLRISKASDGFLCEAHNEYCVSWAVFSGHQVSNAGSRSSTFSW